MRQALRRFAARQDSVLVSEYGRLSLPQICYLPPGWGVLSERVSLLNLEGICPDEGVGDRVLKPGQPDVWGRKGHGEENICYLPVRNPFPTRRFPTRAKLPTFRWRSPSNHRCRPTRAAWACWPETRCARQRTWECRWRPFLWCTVKGISSST